MRPHQHIPADATFDPLLNKSLWFLQPAHGRGYRFNVDSILLSRFAHKLAPTATRVVDLGAGVGVVGIAYCSLSQASYLELVEVNPNACRFAAENIEQLEGIDVRLREDDVNRHATWNNSSSFDVVLMNPPYAPPASGRPASDSHLRLARQGTLSPFLDAARYLLSDKGSLFVCYPARSLPLLSSELTSRRLLLTDMQFVHGLKTKPARLVLARAQKTRQQHLSLHPPQVG